METDQLKHCPICAKDLPISEFGICRARKDGKNLYCRTCVNAKVTAQRKALKEYKSVRKQYQKPVFEFEPQSYSVKSLFKLSPVEKVKDAIERGFHSQREIRSETKLGADEIGDALANLLLWTREIRTEIIDETRLYFLNETETASVEDGPRLPARKRDVPSSFSCLPGLMPGRKPEGEPEKIGGWVAA